MSTSLAPPSNGRKKNVHQRTATRFCDEANIGDNDQLDLAEFIVAAHYLGIGADDSQLMDIFFQMESSLSENKAPPKEVIKSFVKKVEEQYGGGDDDKLPLSELKDSDELDETEHEIVGKTLADAVNAEDAQWQEIQIDGFLSAAAQDQNLQIARKLLADTALTTEDVAQITGVNVELLSEYDDDEEDEEYETDEEEDEDNKDDTGPTDVADVSKTQAIVIQASDMGKSMALTNGDLNTLDEIIKGGIETVSTRSEEVLALLKKMQQAVKLSPGGKKTMLKAQQTMRLVISQAESQDDATVNEPPTTQEEAPKTTEEEAPKIKEEDTTVGAGLVVPKAHVNKQSSEYALKEEYDIVGVKLPSKFRVVIHPGALVKESIDIRSNEVAKVPIGTVVIVEEIDGRRARVSSPVVGWVSLHAKDARTILQKENTSSKEMEQAVHAQRARQTKILILKSITTLNDATVTRILEKSDWNLRRAIEAFYMAKYKTQQYMDRKAEEAAKNNETADSPTSTDGGDTTDDAPKRPKQRRSIVQGWWGSWKTFSKQNR